MRYMASVGAQHPLSSCRIKIFIFYLGSEGIQKISKNYCLLLKVPRAKQKKKSLVWKEKVEVGRAYYMVTVLSTVLQAVPYADPHPPFHRKCAFDVGDCESC